MPDDYKIIDVLAGEISPGVEGWSIITERPGDIRWQDTFPKVIFEWRAAEYGLTDPAEILDIVLHEPYRDTPTPALPPSVKAKAPTRTDAKAADPHGPTLQEATSTAAARDAHRSRIAAVKANKARFTDPDGLLPHIHQNHGMDPDQIRAKRETVDMHRWTRLYGGLPIEPTQERITRA